MSAAGKAAWDLAFSVSPILLTGGIAQNIPGGILPIVALTDPATFLTGGITDISKFFATWYVLSGATLINQKIPTYPLLNQVVAANATIADGQSVSMMMIATAKPSSAPGGKVGGALLGGALSGTVGGLTGTGVAQGIVGGAIGGLGGYAGKFAIMSSLKNSIEQHNSLGGTYSLLTPVGIYTNCLLSLVRDVSSEGETQQRQVRWQWDFYQPLVLTLAAADNTLNSLMSKIKKGLPMSGASQSVGVAGAALGPLTSILPPVQGISTATTFTFGAGSPSIAVPR